MSADTAAVDFRVAFGFSHVADVPSLDGRRSGFWVRAPDCRTDHQLLAAQYEQAVQLYRHEDTLTWSKLHAALLISGGIATALGFSVQSKGFSETDQILRAMIAGVAALACWGLTVADHSGTWYLSARKQGVVDIERRLYRFGGAMIVHRPVSRMLAASPTRHVLRVMPVLLALSWTIVCVVLLIRAL